MPPRLKTIPSSAERPFMLRFNLYAPCGIEALGSTADTSTGSELIKEACADTVDTPNVMTAAKAAAIIFPCFLIRYFPFFVRCFILA
jgi:hypothetical protein